MPHQTRPSFTSIAICSILIATSSSQVSAGGNLLKKAAEAVGGVVSLPGKIAEETAEAVDDVAGTNLAPTVATVNSVTSKPIADGTAHLVDEITGEVLDAAESVENAGEELLQPVGRGLEHFAHEAGGEIEKAGNSVDYYVDTHTNEILLVVAVAAAVYTACATGCDVVISIGTATIKVGSATLVTSAEASSAAYLLDKEKEYQEEKAKREAASATAPSSSPSLVQIAPPAGVAVDPNQLSWRFHRYLSAQDGASAAYEGDNAIADEVGSSVASELADIVVGPESSGDAAGIFAGRLASLGGTLVTIVGTPVETAGALSVYDDRIEIGKRLDSLLGQATRKEQITIGITPRTAAPPRVIDTVQMPPSGPTIGAGPDRAPPPLTLDEQNRLKAEVLGGMTGLTSSEVMQGARDGLIADQMRVAHEISTDQARPETGKVRVKPIIDLRLQP